MIVIGILSWIDHCDYCACAAAAAVAQDGSRCGYDDVHLDDDGDDGATTMKLGTGAASDANDDDDDDVEAAVVADVPRHWAIPSRTSVTYAFASLNRSYHNCC